MVTEHLAIVTCDGTAGLWARSLAIHAATIYYSMVREPPSFHFHTDSTKTTSGQRFWVGLARLVSGRAEYVPVLARADVVYFNISAPLGLILKSRLRRQRVVIRLDGIYHEKMTSAAIRGMDGIFRRGFVFVLFRLFGPTAWGAFVMNLVSHNYKLLLRAWLADAVIYQSEFSRKTWEPYLRRKRGIVIVNGAIYLGAGYGGQLKTDGPIRAMTTYDSWRPAKRLHDIVQFVRWHNENLNPKIELFVVGYDPQVHPINLTAEDRAYLNECAHTPPFREYTDDVLKIMAQQHLFLFFSFRDPCPNVVVEAMARGLPVVALRSGGVPEIVGSAGELVPEAEIKDYFCSFGYSADFPDYDRAEVAARIRRVVDRHEDYRNRVANRFKEDLDLNIVAERYLSVLQEFR